MRGGWALTIFWLLASTSAQAYVRSTSPKSGVPFTWLTSCITMYADARGSQDLTIEQVNATLAKSAKNWSDLTNVCGTLRLTTAPAQQPEEVGADGHPVVVFRDVKWQRPGSLPHDPAAIGLTTVFHVSTPGQPGDATVLDADIELNGVNFTFTTDPENTTARVGTQLADLENTLTHELGHVQGLAHTCWDHSQALPPLDDQGNPAPDCNGLVPQSIIDTTMYPYSLSAGETSKRSPTTDDILGVCEVYPFSKPQAACFEQLHGGCSTEPRGYAWLAELMIAGFVLLALRLRRARR